MAELFAPITVFLNTLAVAFDIPILDWIQANWANPTMDKIMPIVTLFGEGGVFWIAVAVLLLCFRKTRKTGIAMGIALVLGLVVCNLTLKPLIHRVRPFAFAGNEIALLVKTPTDWSFPSGHTIACFEACTVLLLNDKRMGIPATLLAFAVSFSRLYLYVHYPTDVIFSFLAGILFGLFGDWVVGTVAAGHKARKERKAKKV